MPRVSRAQTARNHAAIRAASARLVRERGLDLRLADVLAAAGLTAGGFYGHFGSKSELLAGGCADAFAASAARWGRRVRAAGGREPARRALIEAYLAAEGPLTTGCPMASLAADVSRKATPGPVRAAFVAGLESLLAVLAAQQAGRRPSAARRRALAELSAMVGALVLARAARGTPLATQALAAVRGQLLGSGRRR